MGVIKIRTPNGVQQVRVAGDNPTDEEQQAIINTFFSGQPAAQAADQDTGPVEPELPARKIDYDTGVQDVGFRLEFAKGDNEAERRARLQRLGIPDEAVQIDAEGEFLLDRDLLPEEIKERYDIKGEGLLAIDEKRGFTKNDFVDFYGETRGPLLAATAASVLASPLGWVGAALATGGASTMGYLFDEYQEDQEGLRRENVDDLYSGMKREFITGGLGEAGARGLTSLFGYLAKGSGSQSANEARRMTREVISQGGKPTVRAVNESPILGRLQAIYEGVFPNQKAAQANADFVAEKLASNMKAAGYQGKATDKEKILELIDRDLIKIYGNPDDVLKQAEADLVNLVDQGIDDIIGMFGDTKPLNGSKIARQIEIAKRIFDEDTDMLYSKASQLLGDAKVLPTAKLVQAFERLQKDNPAFDLAGSGLGKFILKFKQGNGYRNATVSEMNGIRTALREAGYDPSLVGTQNRKFIGELLGAIDRSYTDAALQIRRNIGKGRRPDGRFTGKADAQAKDGLDLLEKANKFYGKGVGRFRDAKTSEIFRKYKDGELDVEELFDPGGVLLAPNRGDTLRKFFKSVVPGGRAAIDAPKTFDEFLARGMNAQDAQLVKGLPDDDPLKSGLMRKFEETRRFAQEVSGARGAGVEISEAVRNSMARNFLGRVAVQNKNVFGTPNPAAIAEEINKLGSTGEVLFGKQYKPLMTALRDLGSSGAKVTDRELALVAGQPIAEQVRAINRLTQTTNAAADTTLTRGLSRALADQDPERIVSLIFRKGQGDAIKEATEKLSPETMDAVRQIAMERIVGNLGEAGMTAKELTESVLDGSFSTQLSKQLADYGDETIDAMFGEAGPLLRKLAKESEIVSNKPIKGLGGLAPATIAGSLSLAAFLSGPMGVISTAGGLFIMSRALRSNTFLKTISRPKGVRPGTGEEYDRVGRAFEIMYEGIGQTAPRSDRALPGVTPTVQSEEAQQEAQAQAQEAQQAQQGPNVFQPITMTRAPQVAPAATGTAGQVSPILLPDPATQALAQSLRRTTP